MIKFLKVFLVANCIVAGLVSTIYVLGCFITWSIIPVWTVQNIHPETFRLAEVCLACVSVILSFSDLEI